MSNPESQSCELAFAFLLFFYSADLYGWARREDTALIVSMNRGRGAVERTHWKVAAGTEKDGFGERRETGETDRSCLLFGTQDGRTVGYDDL